MPLKCTRRRGRLAPSGPAVRLDKAADTEVAKQRRHPHSDQKAHSRIMVRRGLMQRGPHLPRAAGSEHREYPKENSSQLQPQCSGKSGQRPTHRLAKPLTPFLQPLPGLPYLRCRPRGLLPNPGRLRLTGRSSRRRSRNRNLLRTVFLLCRGRVRRRRRIHSRHQRLGRCTSPDTKRTAKSNRIHTSKCSRSRHPYESSTTQQTPLTFAASNRRAASKYQRG
jgi:hypothetical protein